MTIGVKQHIISNLVKLAMVNTAVSSGISKRAYLTKESIHGFNRPTSSSSSINPSSVPFAAPPPAWDSGPSSPPSPLGSRLSVGASGFTADPPPAWDSGPSSPPSYLGRMSLPRSPGSPAADNTLSIGTAQDSSSGFRNPAANYAERLADNDLRGGPDMGNVAAPPAPDLSMPTTNSYTPPRDLPPAEELSNYSSLGITPRNRPSRPAYSIPESIPNEKVPLAPVPQIPNPTTASKSIGPANTPAGPVSRPGQPTPAPSSNSNSYPGFHSILETGAKPWPANSGPKPVGGPKPCVPSNTAPVRRYGRPRYGRFRAQ